VAGDNRDYHSFVICTATGAKRVACDNAIYNSTAMVKIAAIAVLAVTCSALFAQEVRSIDLTLVEPRTELRHPPPPPAECDAHGTCVGGGVGGGGVGDGAPDRRDPHALGVYLLRVSPTELNPAHSFEAEFRVLNTGLVSVEIPASPHLSDLQPGDESATFSYFSLALVVRVSGESEAQKLASVGFVELYGSPDHEASMLVLRPGEWIRVKANVKLRSPLPGPASVRFQGEFWLRRNTFRPRQGGAFTETVNLYPNVTPTPSIPVHLLATTPASAPKQ